MAAILNLTTGIVFLKSWSGTISGGTLSADTIKLDSTNQDVILVRDGANILAQKNGTNAQTLRMYGSTTNSSYSSLAGVANIITTSTDGLVLANETPSTAGVPVQQSPRIRLRANVWNTTATAANNTNDWFIESVPVSGTTPSGLLKFGSSLNGAAATFPFTFSNLGQLGLLDGTAGAPSVAFASELNTGIYRSGTNAIALSVVGGQRYVFTDSQLFIRNSAGTLSLGVGTDSAYLVGEGANVLALKHTTNLQALRVYDATGTNYQTYGGNGIFLNTGVLAISAIAPTIASGFGASPSIPNSNGTAAFTINVGTGGAASSGVLTFPAAATGWVVDCVDITNAATAVTVQTAGTTTSVTLTNYSRTTGLEIAWAASDIIRCKAMAY